MEEDPEEWEGLRALFLSRLISLQEAVTQAGRLEEELAALASRMDSQARALPRPWVAPESLEHGVVSLSRARDAWEAALAEVFEAAEARSVRGVVEREPCRPPPSTVDLVARARSDDLLLFETEGVHYACPGPVKVVELADVDGSVLAEAFLPARSPRCLLRARLRQGDLLLRCDRIRGLLEGFGDGHTYSLEPLGHSAPPVAGRFRLRDRWYHLIR